MEFRRVQFWLFCLLVSVVLGEEDEARCLKKIIAKGFSVRPRMRVHQGPGQTKQIFIEYNEEENRPSFSEDSDDERDKNGKNTKAVIDLRDLCKFVGSDGKVYYDSLRDPSRPAILTGSTTNNGLSQQLDTSGYSTRPQTNLGGFSARGSSLNAGLSGQFNGYQGNGYDLFSNPSTGFNRQDSSGQNNFATQGSFPQTSFGGFSTQGGGLLNQNPFSSQGQLNQNAGFQGAGLFNQNTGFSSQGTGQFNQNAGFTTQGTAGQFNQNDGFSNQGAGFFNQNPGFSSQGTGQFNQNAGFSNQNAGFLNQNAGFSNQGAGLFNQNRGFSSQGTGQFNQNAGFSDQNAGFSNQNAGFLNQGAGLFNQNTGFSSQGTGQLNQNAGLSNQSGFSTLGGLQFGQNGGFSNQGFNQNGFGSFGNFRNFRNGYRGPC